MTLCNGQYYTTNMEWNATLIAYWCEHYYQLRDYELNPFERQYATTGLPFRAGSKSSIPPYEETCDLNWEFDKALTGLGESSQLFKKIYLDGNKPTKKSKIIYDRFCKLLMEA